MKLSCLNTISNQKEVLKKISYNWPTHLRKKKKKKKVKTFRVKISALTDQVNLPLKVIFLSTWKLTSLKNDVSEQDTRNSFIYFSCSILMKTKESVSK